MKVTKKLRLKVVEKKLKYLYRIRPIGFEYSEWIEADIEYWETYQEALKKDIKLQWVIDDYDGLPYLELIDE